MKYIDASLLIAEIERLKKKTLTRNSIGVITGTGVYVDANDLLSFLDTLQEQPVEYPTSTEMIAEWENTELPMLREKDFRGDAERMAYNAFMDGFAKGLGYRK